MIRFAGRALGLALLLIAATLVLQILSLPDAWAGKLDDAPVIFDVRRSLPLEPNEPVYHDFYINAGPETGLKKGMYVTVVRQLPVHDPIQNKQQATLNVTVGKLQVLQVEDGLTVARLNSELGDEERPVLEFEAIMIGDKVDLSSATTEAPKATKKKPRTSARNEVAPVEVTVQVAEVAPMASAPLAPSLTAAAPATVPEQAAALASLAVAGNTGGTKVAVADTSIAKAVTVSGVRENTSPVSAGAGMVRIPVPPAPSQANPDGKSSPQKPPQEL